MLIRHYALGASEEAAFKMLAAVAAGSAETPANLPVSSDTDEPSPTPEAPFILERYRALYKQNSDIVGCVRIDGTQIDYPVMYTGDNFYLSHGFDKKESKSGVPFIDKRCSVGPMGTNTIIYGQHMKNGTMFAGLEGYKDEDFYKAHPVIRFDTLYE
jgi:sortase B